MSTGTKSPSVEEFLRSTLEEAKHLRNTSVTVLRNARAAANNFGSVKSYLKHLESLDQKAVSDSESIYKDKDKPIYLGSYYIPSWLYTYLISDEDLDFICPDGEDVSYEVENWLGSITSLTSSLKFTLIENLTQHHDFANSDVAFMYKKGTKMVKVIATGFLANDGCIQIEYALHPERFERRYSAFRENFIKGNEPSPIIMRVYQKNWEQRRKHFIEFMPEKLDFELFWSLLKTDDYLQVLFATAE